MSTQGLAWTALAWLGSFFFAAASAAESDVNSPVRVAGVPAGFQFLLEKQTTAVDVFFGDVFLTTTLASYTPTTIEFHNPADIIGNLGNLLMPEQVMSDLSGELDSHVGEVCYRPTDKDCGSLAPEKIGVIFDENQFRADVFINPSLLAVQQRTFNRFLPDPANEFSYINNVSLVYSGDDSGSDQLGLNGSSLVSVGRHRLVSRWGATDAAGDSNANVEMLYWQFDQLGWQYQAGWFRSESRFLSFVPSVDLLGFRFSTSLKARTDLDYAKGTPIELYLPSRSRINIYKDGRFLAADFYEPGNQMLDTSRLPDGAYEIELQIIDSSGQEERVSRFFVKSPRIAPRDEPQYFFELGDVQQNNVSTAFPESRNIPIVQGGYSQRLATSLGLNIGAAATDDDALLEAGLYYVMDQLDLEPKILAGIKGDYGYSLSGFFRYRNWSASYQFRRVWTDNRIVDADDFYLIPAERTQQNLSLSYPLFDGQLQWRYTRAGSTGKETATTTAVSYNRLLPWTVFDGNLRFASEISRSDDEDVVMLRLSWNVRQDAWYHNASTELRSEKRPYTARDNLLRTSYSGSWSDMELLRDDLLVNWRAQADENTLSTGVGASIASELGSARLSLDYLDSDNAGDRVVYVGEASTSISGNKDVIAIGGKQLAESALIAEIGPSDSDSVFKLFINSALYGYLKPGQRVVVPVTPYQTYDVSLRDVGEQFVSFERNTRRVVVYPGNVRHLLWQPQTLLVLVARIVRPVPGCADSEDADCWSPMINARASGVFGFARTDADGYLQAEVFSGTRRLVFTYRDSSCVVELPLIKAERNVLYPEQDLRCLPDDALAPQL